MSTILEKIAAIESEVNKKKNLLESQFEGIFKVMPVVLLELNCPVKELKTKTNTKNTLSNEMCDKYPNNHGFFIFGSVHL